MKVTGPVNQWTLAGNMKLIRLTTTTFEVQAYDTHEESYVTDKVIEANAEEAAAIDTFLNLLTNKK